MNSDENPQAGDGRIDETSFAESTERPAGAFNSFEGNRGNSYRPESFSASPPPPPGGGFPPNGAFPPNGTIPPGYPPPWFYYQQPKKPNGCLTWVKYAVIFLIVGYVALMVCGMIFGVLLSAIPGTVDSFGIASNGPFGKVSEKTLSGSALAPNKIAILPIEGTIVESEDGFVRRAIRTAAEDPKVKAIVLRINSPGGTISGSDYYYTLLKSLKTDRAVPIIVSMGPMATSGGYYVAMAGDQIFAERSTITGSIGVICMLFNAAGLCEKIGVGMNNITSGANKGMGDFSRPMSDAERAIWQGVVDDAYAQFLAVVREGRPAFAEKPAEKSKEEAAENADDSDDEPKEDATESSAAPVKTLEEIADGRIYTASEAKELGLIDEIGFLDDAVRAAMTRLNLAEGQVQVVRYKKAEGLAELLAQAQSDGAEGRLGALAETLAAPTVYYLAPGAVPMEKE